MSYSIDTIIDCGTSFLRVFSPVTQEYLEFPMDLDYDTEAGWVESVLKTLKKTKVNGNVLLFLPSYILFTQIVEIENHKNLDITSAIHAKINELIPYKESEVLKNYAILKKTVEKIRFQWGFVKESIIDTLSKGLLDLGITPVVITTPLALEYREYANRFPIAVINHGCRSSHLLCITDRRVITKIFYNNTLEDILSTVYDLEKMEDVRIEDNIVFDANTKDLYIKLFKNIDPKFIEQEMNFIPQSVRNRLRIRYSKRQWIYASLACIIILLSFYMYTNNIYNAYVENREIAEKQIEHLERSNGAIIALLNRISEKESKYHSMMAELNSDSSWIDRLLILENCISKNGNAWIDEFEKTKESNLRIKGIVFIDNPRFSEREATKEMYKSFDAMKKELLKTPFVVSVSEVKTNLRDKHMLNFDCVLVLK